MKYMLISALLAFCVELSYSSEAGCIELSRFDYEYKVLQKLTECEAAIKDLQARTKDSETELGDLNLRISNCEDLERSVASRNVAGIESGVTYVRWGRTTCPGNGTDLVYEGYFGGSHFSHKGAAANKLCLPKNPDWDHYEEDVQARAKVYGGEYEFDGGGNGKAVRFFDKGGLDEQNPVCAVCSSVRQRFIMIPGKNTCPDSWTKEYSGYLAAGYHGHEAATEYICLDRQPEVSTEGKPNAEGSHLYFVEAMCGTLPCPPYGQSRELTCVVCTR